MEALVALGAFDAIEANRAALLATLGNAIEAADKGEQFAQQASLFGGAGGEPEPFELVAAAPWGERERLQNEKQSLGFYLSGHPFNAYRGELRASRARRFANLAPQFEPVMLAGVIYGVWCATRAAGAWRCSPWTTAPRGIEVGGVRRALPREARRSSRRTRWSWCAARSSPTSSPGDCGSPPTR
jgi:hypothetical protein